METADTPLRPGLALPTCGLSGIPEGTQNHPEHEPQGQLSGQRHDGELLRDNEVGTAISQHLQGHGPLQAGTGKIYRILQQRPDKVAPKRNESGTIPDS